jgi:hypothetical protein
MPIQKAYICSQVNEKYKIRVPMNSDAETSLPREKTGSYVFGSVRMCL